MDARVRPALLSLEALLLKGDAVSASPSIVSSDLISIAANKSSSRRNIDVRVQNFNKTCLGIDDVTTRNLTARIIT
jgi:hypothetical protein